MGLDRSVAAGRGAARRRAAIACPIPLPERRAPLDVGEEEGDGAGWQIGHGRLQSCWHSRDPQACIGIVALGNRSAAARIATELSGRSHTWSHNERCPPRKAGNVRHLRWPVHSPRHQSRHRHPRPPRRHNGRLDTAASPVRCAASAWQPSAKPGRCCLEPDRRHQALIAVAEAATTRMVRSGGPPRLVRGTEDAG